MHLKLWENLTFEQIAETLDIPSNTAASRYRYGLDKWFFDKYVTADTFAHGQACVDLARVAIGLERYKLAHGSYPESVEVLAPQFIHQLPHDVIGGQPLKYRRTNDNFVLYSIGWNGKDDGGLWTRKIGMMATGCL